MNPLAAGRPCTKPRARRQDSAASRELGLLGQQKTPRDKDCGGLPLNPTFVLRLVEISPGSLSIFLELEYGIKQQRGET